MHVRSRRGVVGFNEIHVSGVTLREVAYLFRSRFRGGYALIEELDAGGVFQNELFDALEEEGHLCEALDDEGTVRLIRADLIDVLADVKPYRLVVLFVTGPLTMEDYRLLERRSASAYPDDPPFLEAVGCRAVLSYRGDGRLMVASPEPWFPHDVLEYFFEKSLLDNERILRADEFERLLSTVGPLLAETGLTFRPRHPTEDSLPIRAIAWSLDSSDAGRFGLVPCYRFSFNERGLQVDSDGAVHVRDYMGLAWYLDWRLRGVRSIGVPLLLGLTIVVLLRGTSSPHDSVASSVMEILLLVVLVHVLFGQRRHDS